MPASARNRGHRLAAYRQCSVDPPAVGHAAVVLRRAGADPFPTRAISVQSDLTPREREAQLKKLVGRSDALGETLPESDASGFRRARSTGPEDQAEAASAGDSRSSLGRYCDGAASTRSRPVTSLDGGPPNKRMKLTRLSAAPGRQAFDAGAEGAASCPRRPETPGTASQLMRSVRRTQLDRG